VTSGNSAVAKTWLSVSERWCYGQGTLEMLKQAFQGHLISRGIRFYYPLHSPDLKLLDATSGSLKRENLSWSHTEKSTGPTGKHHVYSITLFNGCLKTFISDLKYALNGSHHEYVL
jgi:hypothetical protein